MEMQNCLTVRSDTQNDYHGGGHLEILQITSPEPYVGLNRNLAGGISAIWREFLKWLCSNIQVDRYGDCLKICK